jgi:antirestriction protein ArdC
MQQQQKQFDIYEKVTTLIIEQLEQGVIPWRKPWNVAGLPMNLLTRRAYTGVNYLLLNALPYAQQYYLTWKQVKAMAGSVLPGEKGHFIVFRKTIEVPDEQDTTKKVKKSVLRYYIVFNISQCKDIPSILLPKQEEQVDNKPLLKCELVVEDISDCPLIQHGGSSAFYLPSADTVQMPPLEVFKNSESYYCTLFHELIHSTGHEKRLNRKEITEDTSFGDELYSVEELVAEIGACYLNAYCGIENENIVNNTAYIQNWLQQLRNDKRFIVQASFRAQKAVDYILGVQRTTEEPETIPAEQME